MSEDDLWTRQESVDRFIRRATGWSIIAVLAMVGLFIWATFHL